MSLLKIFDYTYNLPQEKIALFPLPHRDHSKLLVYNKGKIEHTHFQEIISFLPAHSFLFFNDTKVIPARLHFKKESGAEIEIFLLSPVGPSVLFSEVMQATETCVWECTIGNLKRWHENTTLSKTIKGTLVKATLLSREKGLVQFDWSGKKSFAEVVSIAGETPLPPYLKRKAEESDRERYQTIYSHYDGAVAAPTAGLHFTQKVFEDLNKEGVLHDFITLHVSAGTFQPVKNENVNEHTMHHEQIIVTKNNLENLLRPDKFIVAVGTTSMRTLESIYWFGVQLLQNKKAKFEISQNDPYNEESIQVPKVHAIEAVKNYLTETNQEMIIGETSIFIKPGYKFRVCDGLITNFHQPASTLILLVAAFVGNDWKKVYDEALSNNYRFLSYGDSSLLIP